MNNDLKDILDNRELKEFPFKVPENYFDTLTDRIMANIPEETKKKKTTRIFSLHPMKWAASIACIIAISASSILYVSRNSSSSVAINAADTMSMPSPNNSYDIIIEAADYTMLDNQEIYMLLADE